MTALLMCFIDYQSTRHFDVECPSEYSCKYRWSQCQRQPACCGKTLASVQQHKFKARATAKAVESALSFAYFVSICITCIGSYFIFIYFHLAAYAHSRSYLQNPRSWIIGIMPHPTWRNASDWAIQWLRLIKEQSSIHPRIPTSLTISGACL